MRTKLTIVALISTLVFITLIIFSQDKIKSAFDAKGNSGTVELPSPKFNSSTSVEKALKNRRSIRDYKNTPIDLSQLSQLLWAAQGITKNNFFRTAPSAGALYPLEIYIAAGNVKNLEQGIYKYLNKKHKLKLISKGDSREKLYNATRSQSSIKRSAITIVIGAVYSRVTKKYHDRGIKFTHYEAGHAAQNIYLQAVSLNLGTVVLGAYDDNKVKKVMKMNDNETPLCLMPVGNIK